jgi:trk system potassium uptake protein TrkH
LLSLPFSQQAEPVSAIDNLFTAVSAVSTTWLATVSTPKSYSFFGEIVILVLIQLGGIGYMTLGSFILLARHRELPAEQALISFCKFVCL